MVAACELNHCQPRGFHPNGKFIFGECAERPECARHQTIFICDDRSWTNVLSARTRMHTPMNVYFWARVHVQPAADDAKPDARIHTMRSFLFFIHALFYLIANRYLLRALRPHVHSLLVSGRRFGQMPSPSFIFTLMKIYAPPVRYLFTHFAVNFIGRAAGRTADILIALCVFLSVNHCVHWPILIMKKCITADYCIVSWIRSSDGTNAYLFCSDVLKYLWFMPGANWPADRNYDTFANRFACSMQFMFAVGTDDLWSFGVGWEFWLFLEWSNKGLYILLMIDDERILLIR